MAAKAEFKLLYAQTIASGTETPRQDNDVQAKNFSTPSRGRRIGATRNN